MTLLLGAAYYPEHRDPARWEFDLEMMAQANLNCVRVGEFAWSRFEPREGAYDFAWLDRFNEMAAEHSIRLLVCPPIRTVPPWLVEKDPTILLVREDGIRLAYGSRYTFCINHPLLREKGEALAEAMAAHYANNENVVGYHLDNEHGDEPDCHCSICRQKFQAWCRDRYGTIEALNEAWGTVFWGMEFDKFEQIPTPAVTKTHHNPGHLLAWRRFRSECTVEVVALQADAVRAQIDATVAGSAQFITTNNQPLWNNRTDYYKMADHLDVAGTNYYPPYGEDVRALALGLAMCRSYKQQPFQVHELRNGPHMIPGAAQNTPEPGEIARLTMHTVANGANAAFYFRWRTSPFGCEQSHGSPTGYDGEPKRAYEEVKEVFGHLQRLSDRIEGTSVKSDVALLVDFPTRWLMETGVRWNGPASLYMDHAKKLHSALRRQGVNCDVVARYQDFSPYKLLVVPALAAMDDDLVDRLASYVHQGGTLVWHPLSGIKDAEANIYPGRVHPKLRPLLGVDVTEFATLGEGESVAFTWQQRSYEGYLFCDLPTLAGAEVWGTYSERWFAGTPAVTRRDRGDGSVVYVCTFASADFYHDLFELLTHELSVPLILRTALPDAVEITERRDQQGNRLVFLLNSTGTAQRFHLPEPMYDLYHEEALEGPITLAPWGIKVLELQGK
ncbi:MAG: beta-galactosidase [Anaerolineae bacterium]